MTGIGLKTPELRGFYGIIKTAPESAGNTRQGLTARIDSTDWRATAMVPKLCSLEGCTRPSTARELCGSHYVKLKREGNLPPRLTREERFWAKIDKTEACWNWTASTNEKGYGHFHHEGGTQAHRYSYALHSGPIPSGMLIDHLCHNRRCVNPEHLRLATPKQNEENRAGANPNGNSGVRGVGWHKATKKWRGFVMSNYTYHHVGLFDSREDAEAAVVAKRNELFTHNEKDRRTA